MVAGAAQARPRGKGSAVEVFGNDVFDRTVLSFSLAEHIHDRASDIAEISVFLDDNNGGFGHSENPSLARKSDRLRGVA